jgi:hypothetical protein
MSRSGYDDGCDDQWGLIRWRGAVTSAIRGRKGQAFLRELLAALDALPEKRLIPHSFGAEGSYCTLGAVCASRGVEPPVVDVEYDDPWDIRCKATKTLGIPDALAAEIMFLNDDGGSWDGNESPERRWSRMRKWVTDQIKPDPQP